MMMQLKAAALAGAALGMLAASPAMSASGVITFRGALSAVTCTVSGGGANGPNFSVSLPEVGTYLFPGPGLVSPSTPYTIVVGGRDELSCPEGTSLAVKYDATSANVDPSTGNLVIDTTANAATNLQFQILDGSRPIDLRTGDPSSPTKINGGSARLPFAVRYISTSASVGAGVANSSIQYAVIYL